MIKQKKQIQIDSEVWDVLVENTYDRPYCFQQQKGCRNRGGYHLTIPSRYTHDDEMNEEIPEEINGEIMGVKFKKWLERDPKQPVDGSTDYSICLWWGRNFYPDVHTVANDLYEKGLIEAGEYCIDIDW